MAALERAGQCLQADVVRAAVAREHDDRDLLVCRQGVSPAQGPLRTFDTARDGRGVLVRLTDEGRVRVDAAMSELIRREARALNVLSRDDIDELARMLRPLMG